MSMEEAAAETVSPAVAEGPYTLSPNGDILAADGTAIGRVPVRWNDLRVDDFASPRDGWAFAEERARLEGSLIAASWDMRAVCEETAEALRIFTEVDGDWLTLEHASDLRTAILAALAKARGLRPCDDPALVPEVRKAQPQCPHGEKMGAWRYETCPFHRNMIGSKRHEHPNGGVWYTYVCDGYLEEMKGREG